MLGKFDLEIVFGCRLRMEMVIIGNMVVCLV